MLKKITLILIITATVLTSAWVLFSFNILKNPFVRKELKIKDTNVLITDIKSIAELFTYSYYTEIVVDSTKTIPGYFSKTNHTITIIAKGTSYIGTDLSKLDSTNITVTDSSGILHCQIKIPKAKILNTVVNPSGFTIFNDCKCFTPTEVQSIKNKATSIIEQTVINNNILEMANSRTTKLFYDFLTELGFTKVSILII